MGDAKTLRCCSTEPGKAVRPATKAVRQETRPAAVTAGRRAAAGERGNLGRAGRARTAAGLQRTAGNAWVGRLFGGDDSIRPKLRLDLPGDPYEREADEVADQVMRAPAGPAAPTGACGPGCADRVQRLAFDAEEVTPELPPELESRIRAGAAGGEPLPARTRAFFEGRFGRDLGAVRVHQGRDAAALSDELQAYAFTHRNHIWLGAGMRPEPSQVLAHELAHVVHQAGALRPRRSAEAQAGPEDGIVQRFAPYWEPPDYNGKRLHKDVLPELSAQGQIFVEAPVPNADKHGAGWGKARGFADLYDATTTVGVWFLEEKLPQRLGAPRRGFLFSGSRYPHSKKAAPKLGPLQRVRDVDKAPPSITVGDLKPSHGTEEALEGVEQVRGYLKGFELAAEEVRELASMGRASPPNAPAWSPTTAAFSKAGLGALIPAGYKASATGPATHPLVLKQNRRAIRPLIQARGRLVLEPDPHNEGIINYIWVLDQPLTVALPARIRALGQEVTSRIVNPLRAPLEREALTRKAKPVTRREIPVPNRLPPATRRVQRNLKDPFDLGDWRKNRRELARELRGLQRTADVRDAKKAAQIMEAHQAGVKATRLPLPEPPEQTRTTGRTFERIEFWTGLPAGFFGLLRRLFGRTFVRVAAAYARMRDRFREWLRQQRLKGGGGGGLPGAAAKAVFSVLKMAGLVVLRRTIDTLQESLVRGVGRKLTSFVPDENVAALQEKVEEARQLHAQLQQQAAVTAESVVAAVFPNYQAELGRIQDVLQLVGNINKFVNIVRWAARAIACVSPPAIGCLWALAQAVLERAAAAVVQTCWFQRKIAPMVAGLSFLKDDLPRALAQRIIAAVRALLPGRLHDVFDDGVVVTPPKADEIECDDTEQAGPPLSDDQRAVMELQERVGDEKFQALLQLMRERGVPAGVPLNRQRCDQIARLMEGQHALTAEDLRRFARNPRGTPAELTRLLDQARAAPERSPVEPVKFEEPAEEQAEVAVEGPEYTTVVVGVREGGGGERGASSTQVLSAEARPAPDAAGEPIRGWHEAVVRVRGRLTEGAKVLIDLRLTEISGRRQVRNLTRLETVVVEIAPSETRPGMQEAFLEVQRGQDFKFPTGEQYIYMEGGEFVHVFGSSR